MPLVFFLVFSSSFGQEELIPSESPDKGFVPDEETAINIAKAVWFPIYGEKTIRRERPYKAVLNGEVWQVRGSLPKDHKGGVAVAEIAKKTGCILRVYHGK